MLDSNLVYWVKITVAWTLIIFAFVVSIALGESVKSPYKLAEWWIEFGKWRQNRKSR